MAYNFDSALSDPDIEVIARDDDQGYFTIQLKGIPTNIHIDIGRFLTSDAVKFRVSHAIKTPLQAGPYWTSRTIEDDSAYALHRAVNGLTSYYREAVENGHKPSEAWLKEG